MENEYGVKLDSNGYAPSIIKLHSPTNCFLCGNAVPQCVRHEVFHGANREKSKRLGLWVHLCPDCHYKLHFYGQLDKPLKQIMQEQAQSHYEWDIDRFRQEFGKNYL